MKRWIAAILSILLAGILTCSAAIAAEQTDTAETEAIGEESAGGESDGDSAGESPEGESDGESPEGESEGESADVESVEVKEELSGIPYGTLSASQVLDVILPEEEGTYPVIVVLHGGGFLFGDQKMPIIQPILKSAVEHGYAVVSVDYRKSAEAIFPAALSDVKAAVRWIRANADTYGFDPEHIAIWGESAGAYLALMTALTPAAEELRGDMQKYPEESDGVEYLVTFYAPVEFSVMTQQAESIGNTFSGDFERMFTGTDTLDASEVAHTYWESYKEELPEDFSLAAIVQVGDENDVNVPYLQSVEFAQRLADLIGEEQVSFRQFAGAGHEDAAFYTEENLAEIYEQLDAVMK